MKKGKRFFLLMIISLGLSILSFSNGVNAEETTSEDGLSYILIEPQFNWFGISGDEGRFRQDQRIPNDFSGGIAEFEAESADGDIRAGGHAISENDYGNYLTVGFEDESYFKINGKYFRQYYDGSNEAWNPAPYLLADEFADWEDDDLYADRLSQSFEYGRPINDSTKLAFGYDLWGRFGRERLLRGEQSSKTTAPSQINIRSIPNRAYIEGLSHTTFIEALHTTAQGYTLKIRPSFEIYKDYQDIQFYRYSNGSLSQDRTFLDSPQFHDINTEISFNGFLNDNLAFNSGYLFNYLKNGSVRSEVRPVQGSRTFVEPNVDNERFSNTGNVGTVLTKFLGINKLRFNASSRVELADTTARGYGLAGSTSVYRESRSDTKEFWVSEALGLNYAGIRNANLDFNLDLDQRHLDYDEFFDAGSHEIYTTGSWTNNPPQFMSYNTEMFYNDLKATARGSYRFNSHVKASTQYRLRYKDHDYDKEFDSSAVYYPGVLGDILQASNEVTTGLDVWLVDSWTSGLKYQYIADNYKSEAAGEVAQEIDRHRATLSLTGKPFERFTLLTSATIERYILDTPTTIPSGSTWSLGEGNVYDYNGSYFIYNIDGKWAVSEKRSLNCGFQQTSAQGSQENDLYEVNIGFTHKFNDDTEFTTDYFYYDFNDNNEEVPGFDNYFGHGIMLSFSKKFI